MSTSRKRQDGRCRPVEKLSLVDVNQENVRMVGRRRPVEKLSLVDIDQLKTSGWSTVDVRLTFLSRPNKKGKIDYNVLCNITQIELTCVIEEFGLKILMNF